MLIGPWQNAITEFRYLHAVLDDDGVLADQVDTADMAVQIDSHARPVEARCDLLDMGGFTGPVISGNDDPSIEGKTRKDGQRCLFIEQIVRIDVGYMRIRHRIGGNHHIGIESENVLRRNRCIGKIGYVAVDLVHHASSRRDRSGSRRDCLRMSGLK